MLKEIPFTQFKGMLARDIKASKSFIVTTDGKLAFIVIAPQNDFIRESAKEIGILGNNAGGKDIEIGG